MTLLSLSPAYGIPETLTIAATSPSHQYSPQFLPTP